MDRLTWFWALIALSTLGFIAGLAANASVWVSGRIEGIEETGKGARLWFVVRRGLGTLFGPRAGAARRAVLLDGLLHRRLYSEGKLRWLAHTTLALAFLVMFALSLFTGFFEQILGNILGIHTPLVEWVINKDTPVMALLNEALGVLLVAGLALILVRRYLLRPAQLRTAAPDTWTLALLGIGLITAYPVEALRFLAQGAPSSGAWSSFIGYPLALLFKPLAWPWALLHTWTFFAHVLPFMALFVYMPHSKFLHVLVSPIVAAANLLEEGQAR